MNKEEFNDICPYDDSQFTEKLAHLVKEPGFEKAVRYAMPDVNFYKFSKGREQSRCFSVENYQAFLGKS